MSEELSKSEDAGLTCPITREDFCREVEERVKRIGKEFGNGFVFVANYPKSVSFFGSSRFTPENPYCAKAEHLAGRISRELGYAVITGGGGGIMGSANKGAFEAGGESIGLSIRLPRKQYANPYTTAALDFSYFFARKTVLSYAAEAYLFFPGGFGTLDEFFEIVTLVQTHKIRRIPIFLVGIEFWAPLGRYMQEYLHEKHHTIVKHDLDLYKIVDDEDEILQAIKDEPVHDAVSHHAYKKTN
ncbi:MAG: TIGR00730 family Rossman fold protein [bacterium]|nr:TIGR00730 family Rossman fold protein [bacterium]